MKQVMLSSVAERVYWLARYLERIENTARLVSVYANLLLDLPSAVDLSWYDLVTINSSEESFDDRYTVRDERNVIKFILSDDTNSGSLYSSLRMARENARTSRDVVPEETWELVNELYLYVKENMHNGINRRYRHEFLNDIVKACQQISGVHANTMNKDAASEFLRLGRSLERADMTSRILEAGASIIISSEGLAPNFEQLVWANVLRSAGAYQSYRRSVQSAISGDEVAHFLLEGDQFPRSVLFTVERMRRSVKRLPRSDRAIAALDEVKSLVSDYGEYEDCGTEFREHLGELQAKLATLHSCYLQSWFNLGD